MQKKWFFKLKTILWNAFYEDYVIILMLGLVKPCYFYTFNQKLW